MKTCVSLELSYTWPGRNSSLSAFLSLTSGIHRCPLTRGINDAIILDDSVDRGISINPTKLIKFIVQVSACDVIKARIKNMRFVIFGNGLIEIQLDESVI